MEYFLGAPHWLDAVTPPLERHLEYLANTVALLLEREHRADGPGQTTVPGSLRGPATEHSAFGRRRLLVTGSGALAVAASGIAALALRARPKRVSGHPQAAAAPPAQAGARTVTLPAPFAAITVIAADGAASVKLDEAVKDFGAILPQLASDYAPPQSMRWTVHLVSDLSLARQVLAGDIGFNQSAVDSFFKNGNSLQTQYFEAGVQTLFYLPNSPDTRGNLAWAAGSYLTYTQGGNKDDVYPYWFRRGVPIYLRVRFTETGYSLARAASGDVKSGTAPSLSSISVYSDVYAFQAKLSSNTMRVDVRSEAAVEYMAKQYGEAAIGRLLRDNQFGNIPKFTDLLQQVTGMGVQGLDRALNASLTQ